jgi:hypothetical protein
MLTTYLLKIHFNISFSHLFLYFQRTISQEASEQKFCIHFLSPHLSHIFSSSRLLDFKVLTTLGDVYESQNFLLYCHKLFTYTILDQNILLSTLFSNTCSSLPMIHYHSPAIRCCMSYALVCLTYSAPETDRSNVSGKTPWSEAKPIARPPAPHDSTEQHFSTACTRTLDCQQVVPKELAS